MNSRRHKTAVF